MVKRILKKHGFPPNLQEEAIKTVLAQAELLSAMWVVANQQNIGNDRKIKSANQ